MINILDFNIRLKSGDTYSLEVTPRDGSSPAVKPVAQTVSLRQAEVAPPDAQHTAVRCEFDYPLSYMTEFEVNQLDVAARDPAVRIERLKAYGAKLYSKIFGAEVEKLWQEAKARSGFLVACIRIAQEAVGLEALPWETMFDGEEFIAAGAKTGMSRLPLDIPPQDELAPAPLPLKMVADSLPTVRTATASLTTAIGVLQGIYLGVLGFAKFVPEALPLYQKALFIIPLIFWLVALYNCIDVALTKRIDVYMHSPEDIREKSLALAAEKQRSLQWAFWLLTLGLLAAFALLMYRLNM
jgi:hypothetical protein